MKRVTEREEKILRQIEQLETLRPRYEAMDEGLTHYAYNRYVAAIKIISITAIVIDLVVISISCFYPVKDCIKLIGLVGMIIMAVAMTIVAIAEWGGKDYLFATQKTVTMLDRKFTRCQAEIERLERRQRDAEFYQPKFERLESIITQELEGTYLRFEKYHFVRIGFGKYEPENYKLNEEEYGKLIWRIVETRHQPGVEDEFTNLIHDFENSLST